VTRALATVLLIGATLQPAQACHRYKYWAFKTPQRCGAVVKFERQARLVRPPPEDRAPEIVVIPELLDEHDVGLAKLKALLR
jgi:hypothetical protein